MEKEIEKSRINEAEFNLLSIMLQYPNKHALIFDNCSPEFFKDRINKLIFHTASILYANGGEIDNVTIFEKIKSEASQKLTKDAGERLVDLLTASTATTALTKKYCEILYQGHINYLVENAKTEKDFEAIEAYRNMYSMSDVKIKQISSGVEEFDKLYESHKNNRITTGYDCLDQALGSFCGGDYIALGACTGAGKTTIALNLSRMMCLQGRKVLFCSLEMPIEQLRNRFNCINTGLDARKYRTCGFTPEELERYKVGLSELDQWSLYILCDYNLTVEKLKAYATEQKKNFGLDFIVIDYLGLLSGYGNKSSYERVSALSRNIKVMATELNVPVLVLVQLNRDSKSRENKRPVLTDIRESGAIEQDADFVLFAYRDYMFSGDYNKKDDLEIIVAKNRHGISNVTCFLDINLNTQEISNKTNYRNDKTEWMYR
jgi:replicative DNA helicase